MSSGVALALVAAVVVITFTVFALVRMRRTYEEPMSRSGPGPSMEPVRLANFQPEPDSGTRPTLVPLPRPPLEPLTKRTHKAYVAAQEDEDDVPTTLYRKDDDSDVEALLAEFDDDHK